MPDTGGLVRGIVVGLAAAAFCLLIGLPLIALSKRLKQPWIDFKSMYGLVPLTCVVGAGVGLLVALVSATLLVIKAI